MADADAAPWWYDADALRMALPAARMGPDEPAAAAAVAVAAAAAAPAARLRGAAAPAPAASALAPWPSPLASPLPLAPWAHTLLATSSAATAAVAAPPVLSGAMAAGDVVRLARNYEAFSDAVRNTRTHAHTLWADAKSALLACVMSPPRRTVRCRCVTWRW
jgi:hypothetical protein